MMPGEEATGSLSWGADHRLVFDAFQMDVARHRLWREGREIPLRPKSWDVLRYLIGRPGLLVSKDALHREVWPDAAVSDDTLTKSIGELRRALGDDPRTPRFIETVHGRGFRFVADVQGMQDEARGAVPAADSQARTAASGSGVAGLPFVGRQPELEQLRECLRLAGQGSRQLVFITGEAGVGKTALAEEFLGSPALRGPDVRVLRGQCIQQRGPREPYMPVLEVFERVLRSPLGRAMTPLFRRVAPCWYVQVPWLLAEREPEGFPGAMTSAPPERMLREGATFLELMAARSTVVLVLEDVHWSDTATVDLLALLGQRSDPARLLVIATYRPAEASLMDHPVREVKQTLRWRHRCLELALNYLSQANVGEYLHGRFGGEMPDLARLIHARTDGNALFVVAIVEELIRRGRLTESPHGWALSVPADRLDLAVPDDLSDMITSQFRGLSGREQSVLEAASVAGVSFAPQTVARALGWDAEDVEAIAQRLARSHIFLNAAGGPAERGLATAYEFAHALHQHVIYEQIADARRKRLHRVIGETRESTSGDRPGQIAPELSVHFEQSGDYTRAVKYLGLCVARAQQRFAQREAIAYAEHALGLLARLPETPLRDQQELEFRLLLSLSLNVTRGYASREGRENHERARVLCETVGDARQLFELVHAHWYAQLVGAEVPGARRSADELVRLAESLNSGELRWRARLARGRTELWDGHLGAAVHALTRCIEDLERQPVTLHAETFGADPAVAVFIACGLALWFFGCPDQARGHSARAVAHAETGGRPYDVAAALFHWARVELLCGNPETAASLAARGAAVCSNHDVGFFLPGSRFLVGAARAERGEVERGLSEMLRELAERRAVNGPFLSDFMLAPIATACGRAGQWDEGLRRVEKASPWSPPRAKACTRPSSGASKASCCLERREANGQQGRGGRQGDRSGWGVLSTLAGDRPGAGGTIPDAQERDEPGRACLWGTTGVREACQLLRTVYASFTEGFDTGTPRARRRS